MRVLIVEDEALIADYLEALVLSFGYEVCAIAASAPEAVEEAAIHKPDVALMDIGWHGEPVEWTPPAKSIRTMACDASF